MFYVKLDDPANADQVEKEIQQVPGMENYAVRSMQEYLSMMTPDNLPGFRLSIRIVIGVSLIIGFLVIFQSMYAAVMERTREIGILKAMGASKLYIVNVVLRETAVLADGWNRCWSILISLGASWAIMFDRPVLRLVQVVVSGFWIGWSMLVAIVGAIAGALYPAFKAAGKDPIEALAYE